MEEGYQQIWIISNLKSYYRREWSMCMGRGNHNKSWSVRFSIILKAHETATLSKPSIMS